MVEHIHQKFFVITLAYLAHFVYNMNMVMISLGRLGLISKAYSVPYLRESNAKSYKRLEKW